MKKIILVFIVFQFISILYAEIFRFKYNEGEKFRIECYSSLKQFLNKKLVFDDKQEFKTISEVKSLTNNQANLIENNYFFVIINMTKTQVKEIKDISLTNYLKDIYGKMTISKTDYFPTLRNVPVFPENDIKIGDTWEFPASEVEDLFGDNYLSIFPINVKYTFLGYEDYPANKIAKISIFFKLDITKSESEHLHPNILKVIGESNTIMYFNIEKGTREKEIYDTNYTFQIIDNNTKKNYQCIGSGTRTWYPVELMKKNEIIDDLRNDLKKLINTTVEKDDKGIKISLENIQFKANSDELLPSENDRIVEIAKILKRYTDHGLLITRHTADTGKPELELSLSIKRAMKVTELLKSLNSINIDKSAYIGKGSSVPVAANDTELNMQKNRCVEIII